MVQKRDFHVTEDTDQQAGSPSPSQRGLQAAGGKSARPRRLVVGLRRNLRKSRGHPTSKERSPFVGFHRLQGHLRLTDAVLLSSGDCLL